MTYRKDSGWNDKTEMMCLLILKRLQAEGFPRGRQSELCEEMANRSEIFLTKKSIQAKVGNYKSIAKINNSSNASKGTERIYNKSHNFSIKQLEEEIDSHG